jgi:hypothetical protein
MKKIIRFLIPDQTIEFLYSWEYVCYFLQPVMDNTHT